MINDGSKFLPSFNSTVNLQYLHENHFSFRFYLNEAHTNIEAMSCLTDHILYDIQYSHDPNLEAAKQLLNRVHMRHLYTFIGSYNLLFVSMIFLTNKFKILR